MSVVLGALYLCDAMPHKVGMEDDEDEDVDSAQDALVQLQKKIKCMILVSAG